MDKQQDNQMQITMEDMLLKIGELTMKAAIFERKAINLEAQLKSLSEGQKQP